MNHDPATDVLRRLNSRTIRPRPLDPGAERRIRQRIDEAFEREAAAAGSSGPTYLVPIPDAETNTRGGGPRRALAAAVVAVIVIGLAVVIGDSDDAVNRTADSASTSTPTDPPQPGGGLLTPGSRWSLVGEPPIGGDGTAPALIVRIDDRVDGGDVTAIARVSTSDMPPLQYQGTVRFAAHDDRIDPPMFLLDPQRAWVDCDATIDVTASGSATCAGDTVVYTSSTGTTDEVDTPLGTRQATRVVIDWQLDTDDPMRTTVWTTDDGGPLRIEVADGITAVTYSLTDLEMPPPPTTEPGG
jgi:hypothetical protein